MAESLRRKILRRQLCDREQWKSAVDRNQGCVVKSTAPDLLLDAEHMGEVFVTKGDVMCRAEDDRGWINNELNCVMLHHTQNVAEPGLSGFSREVKAAAMRYLINLYGTERIQAFLTEHQWGETVEQICSRVSSAPAVGRS